MKMSNTQCRLSRFVILITVSTASDLERPPSHEDEAEFCEFLVNAPKHDTFRYHFDEQEPVLATPSSWIGKDGYTLLHLAASYGAPGPLRLMLQASKTDTPLSKYWQWPDARWSGYTPLHQAALNGKPECVRLLLDAGAATAAMRGQEGTPAEMARRSGFDAVAEMIEQYQGVSTKKKPKKRQEAEAPPRIVESEEEQARKKRQAWLQVRDAAVKRYGPDVIWGFHEENWDVFSNMYEQYDGVTHYDDVTPEGMLYPTTEHAYQAAKVLDLDVRKRIQGFPNGKLAKTFTKWKAFKRAPRRMDWQAPQWVKLDVMEDLLRQKFRYPHLMQKLLATGDRYIMEGNVWNDTFWGMIAVDSELVGQNNLGNLLMRIRGDFQTQQAQEAASLP